MIPLGTASVLAAVLAQDRLQIQFLHHLSDEPRQMVLGQPVLHRRWHQKRLIQTATAKALAHASNIISAKAGGNKTFYNKNVLLPKLGFFIPTGCRSEEHTSELQSHVNIVCRLLLEKKK